MDGFVEQDGAALLPYDTLDPTQHFHHLSTWPPLDIMSHNHNANANDVDSSASDASNNQIGSQSLATTATATIPMLQTSGLSSYSHQALDPSAAMMTTGDWQFQLAQPSSQHAYSQDTGLDMTFHTGPFGAPMQTSPIDDFIATSQGQINNSLASSYLAFSSSMDQMSTNMAFQMQDFHNELMNNFSNYDGVQSSDYVASVPSSIPNSSPGENWLDTRSISNRSDNSWTMIDHFPQARQSFESFTNSFSNEIMVSPQQHHLHVRTSSDSSHHSDVPLSATLSAHSWEEGLFPISPEPEASLDYMQPQHLSHGVPIPHEHDHTQCSSMQHSPISALVQPLPIQPLSAPSSSTSPVSSGAGSPTTKRRKSPASMPGVTSKAITKKKASTTPAIKDGKPEKKVGKRRGPLKPEQRQSAHEIRKLRACLRCKFLKKVCDKGDPCGGCQPSHTRLWQVPCTRIDIKELAYFLKDWNADYERHVTLGFSIANIKGFSTAERQLYITHGYGFYLPILAREVYVRDDKCFGVDWVEDLCEENPRAFDLNTAKLSAGMEGVSHSILSEYLDQHIDGGFELFVDNYFDGTAFLTEILKTVYRYYLHSKLPVIRKALKLVVAYALTLHITMVSGLSDEEMQVGKVEEETSRYFGQTVAPVMINFQVKKAMADTWRELMKDILEELSALFSSVYSGEKHKNWPTIFMLASIVLVVWELMQFDCHFRVPDQSAVQKFCNEMESTPVGVIVGLFSAISTKLPSFLEWDTKKHHHLLNSNVPVCDAMSEVRSHVEKYEPYLKGRSDCKFDRGDFDCLSNKFLAKLVIRAN